MTDQLLSIPLFHGLNRDELDKLLHRIPHQIKNYNAGTVIALNGEVVTSQMILIEGSVKGEMYDFTGKAIKIEDIPSPRLLAPAFLFGKQNTYPVNITANTRVVLLVFLKGDFICLLQDHQDVLTNYLDSVSDRAQFLSSKLRFLSFQTIRGKIAHLLLELSGKHQSMVVEFPSSQGDLADLFGVTRPSFARVLSAMNKDRIIRSSGRSVRILDKKKLSGLLNA